MDHNIFCIKNDAYIHLLSLDKRSGMGLIAYYIFKRKFDEDLSSKEFFYIKKTIVKFQFDNDIPIYDEFIEPNSKLDGYLDYLQKTQLKKRQVI